MVTGINVDVGRGVGEITVGTDVSVGIGAGAQAVSMITKHVMIILFFKFYLPCFLVIDLKWLFITRFYQFNLRILP